MTKALDIDLRDPHVRAVIDHDRNRTSLKNPTTGREMVQLAGDAPDPTGMSRHRGAMSTHRLDSEKIEVLVAYRGRSGEFDLTVDVYMLPGQPIELHIICPRCRNKSRITGERKKIEFSPNDTRPYTFVDGSKYPTNGGRLDVETFECGWELDNKKKHVVGLREGGMNLCRMVLAIDHNVAKDA